MKTSEELRLEGNLTVREVPDIYRALDGCLPKRIDMTDVGQTDSSALALLLECHARARAAGRTLEVVNAPESLRVIARLTDVAELIGLDGNNREDTSS